MSDPVIDGVRAGEARAVARAISRVETGGPDGERLVHALFPHAGRAFVVGVTGSAGAGKSTLVDRLTAAARAEGRTVGVLAVDPSSPFSGGALLGDRVRMLGHAADAGVFIRSLATRGRLGGVSSATADAVTVLDAAGMDVVFVETVGVGQDEVDVAHVVDVTVVVLVPEGGDDVQALKAGIMEIADVFVVNKADRTGGDHTVHAVAAMQALRPIDPGAWQPPIVRTEATTGVGVSELWHAILSCRERLAASGAARRREQQRWRLRELLGARWVTHVEQVLPEGALDRAADAMASHRIDPYSTVDDLMARALQTSPPPAHTPGSTGRPVGPVVSPEASA